MVLPMMRTHILYFNSLFLDDTTYSPPLSFGPLLPFSRDLACDKPPLSFRPVSKRRPSNTFCDPANSTPSIFTTYHIFLVTSDMASRSSQKILANEFMALTGVNEKTALKVSGNGLRY